MDKFQEEPKKESLAGLGRREVPGMFQLLYKPNLASWNHVLLHLPNYVTILMFLQKRLIQEIKMVFRVLVLYIPLPMFWALFDQQVKGYIRLISFVFSSTQIVFTVFHLKGQYTNENSVI